MLNYLAAALPAGTSAAARLLALQCALRMNTKMQVRLTRGMLRSLGLNATQGPWRELEHARWLRTVPGNTSVEAAELLDAALLDQAPARPDRMCAADWALRASSPSTAGTVEPLRQLASVYLAVHAEPEAGKGVSEADQMARSCGVGLAALPTLLAQLTATGLLKSWQICSNSGDLHWTLARGKEIHDTSHQRATAGSGGPFAGRP
ncbi:hypothetical protein ABT269_22510 [Streptomyces viridosporus]|uniref:hypothetical protein n=1 Tax=Streptomyces viridosporus TaxID=67581 RepID=UPI003333341A